MHKYRAIYFYRNSKPEDGLDLTKPENWDGQELIDFTSDTEIGSLEDFNKTEQMKALTGEIGRSTQHYMITIVRIVQGIEGGESFIHG
jgi:hypothetical protein